MWSGCRLTKELASATVRRLPIVTRQMGRGGLITGDNRGMAWARLRGAARVMNLRRASPAELLSVSLLPSEIVRKKPVQVIKIDWVVVARWMQSMQFAAKRASLSVISLKEKLIKIGAKIVTTIAMSRSRWRRIAIPRT